MADNTIDVMMRVVGTSSEFAADSLTIPVINDELQKDFRPGYFCDLLEFSFSAGSKDAMSKQSKDQKDAEAIKKNPGGLPETTKAPAPKWQKSGDLLALEHVEKQRRKVEKRRAISNFMDMQPVDFTRIMDSCSTLLFKSLVNCETIKEVSVIKRKAAGITSSGLCYLRLDFKQVLFTRLDWKDEQNVVHESGTFIYRGLKVQYRPQLPSGDLGAIVPMDWTMVTT